MRMRFVTALAVLAFAGMQAFYPPAEAADCSQGTDPEKIACLDGAVKQLTAKVETMTKDLAESLKWNDRVALRNEDMRIYPRCLDNPGPNSPNITDVFANSCAKVSAQSWMLVKPYH